MKVINYSAARKNLRSVIDEVVETGIPTCITSKSNQVVIISKDEFDSMVKQLESK